jgi:hypothetical protein
MRAVKTPKQLVSAYDKLGSLRAIARETGQSHRAVQTIYRQALAEGLITKLTRAGTKTREESKVPKLKTSDVTGRVNARTAKKVKRSGVTRYLFSSAQNNTKVWMPLWNNLQALAAHYSAEICVSRYTYNKQGLGAAGDKARVVKRKEATQGEDMWWDPVLAPYYRDERLALTKDLTWCGEMNIIPTAPNPLSGLENYVGMSSGIFPHAKIAMESVATGKHEATKFNYTTGTVTLRNYIQRKAGFKADFHHAYGALLVEIDEEGNWFARQINANSQGTICDLNLVVKDGLVSETKTLAISWGDIHVAQLEPSMRGLWAPGGMLSVLNPGAQFLHDVLDFKTRNHHDRDFHSRMRTYKMFGTVEEEVKEACAFIETCGDYFDGVTVVVASNHDDAATQWLRETDYRTDPPNARFFLESQLTKVISIEEGDSNFSLMEHYLGKYAICHPKKVRVLREDESYLVGDIECGMHGHRGINGARGTRKGLTKTGRKSTIGHSHSAGITDGVYQGGTCSKLDMGYNHGPGSWSHSQVVTYINGKRAIVTCRGEQWRVTA